MKRPEAIFIRRFARVAQKPAGYANSSGLSSADLALPEFHHIHEMAWRMCEGSQWHFPNQGRKPCKLAFDFLDNHEFEAVAWYDPVDATHWILFNRGTIEQLGEFFTALFAAPAFLESLGVRLPGREIPMLRLACLRLSIEFLFLHEWMHVVLGHTGLEAADRPLGAVGDHAPLMVATNSESPLRTSRRAQERQAQERAADYFAAVRMADSSWERRFLFLGEDELPLEAEPKVALLLSFLGAAAVPTFFAASGHRDGVLINPYYPTLRARLVTLFHGFTIVANKRAGAQDWPDTVLTTVIRNLAAGLSSMPMKPAQFAQALIAAMDSENQVDEALAEVRTIESQNELMLPRWAPFCVAAEKWD